MISPRFVPQVSRLLGWVCILIALPGALATLGFLAVACFGVYSSNWYLVATCGAVAVGGVVATGLVLLVSYLLFNWTKWVTKHAGLTGVFD